LHATSSTCGRTFVAAREAAIARPGRSDPAGAARVQELMGGRFGEMSTLMNYTFQSFNFRNRQGARPFYDLIANIAAEEYGHIALVAITINTMLTGARRPPPADGRPPGDALAGLKNEAINPHHFIAGGQGALPQGFARDAVDGRRRKLT
jgi:Mn-containing catalase